MAMFGMTDDMKARLIEEIKKRPLIWKVTNPAYTDVPSRWLAFEDVARELSDDRTAFTSDMIKISWKNMMDYYNQIRRRHDRATVAGTYFARPKWQFYDMMQFVRQDKPIVKRKYNWIMPSQIDQPYDADAVSVTPSIPNPWRNREEFSPKEVKSEFSDQTPANQDTINQNLRQRTVGTRRRKAQVYHSDESSDEDDTVEYSRASVPSRVTSRREGLRQAPKKTSWLDKKEYIVDDIGPKEYEPPKKAMKRSPAGATKTSQSVTPSPKKYANGSPRKGASKDDILSPIKRSAVEPLAHFDFLTAFARKVEARLNALPPSQRYVACKAVEDTLESYEMMAKKSTLKRSSKNR